MFKVTVSKPGSSFLAGLYPEANLDNALAYFEKNGYTVLMVENLSA